MKQLSQYKRMIYEGLLQALGNGAPRETAAILVDQTYGEAILLDAANLGIVTCAPVEKSGQAVFDFEYGSEFEQRLGEVAPTFAKALVRYNPEDDGDVNRLQRQRLKVLSDYAHMAGYKFMFDPQVIRDNQWPHTVGLLRVARDAYCRTALATMSFRNEALHVLRALDLEDSLDIVLTREDVQQPKPDPEIYLTACGLLGVAPEDCIVIEDSPNGVRAGVAAGTNVVAFATPFTKAGLHSSQALEHPWVVHEPEQLLEVVRERVAEHNRVAH